jgi:hypothetical protein
MLSSAAETDVASLKTTQIAAARKNLGLLGDVMLPPGGARADFSANLATEAKAITIPSPETRKIQGFVDSHPEDTYFCRKAQNRRVYDSYPFG